MKTIELIGYEARLNNGLQLNLGTDGSYGIEQLQILPGEGWQGLEITATFHTPGGAAVQLWVPEDGILDVPPQATLMGGVVAEGCIVFSGTAEGVQRISCDLPYSIMPHAGVSGGEDIRPDPDLLQQALEEIRAACKSVAQAEERIAQMEGSAPIKLSQLENDCGYVTDQTETLARYYKKSETYTQQQINELVSAVPKFKVEVVQQLPTVNIAANTVYLVAGGQATDDLYTEYLYVNGRWELLGTQTVTSSGGGGVSAAWVNAQLAGYQPAGDYALRTELPAVPVQSVNGKQGAVVLQAEDLQALPQNAQAADSAKLGGQLPAYYASAAGLDAEVSRAKAAEQSAAAAAANAQSAAAGAISALSVNGKTITYTKNDGTTGTVTTQDTVYTLPTGNASAIGGLKLSDSVSSTSSTGGGVAATPAAAKKAYDKVAMSLSGTTLTITYTA